jgi:hypothetical protein
VTTAPLPRTRAKKALRVVGITAGVGVVFLAVMWVAIHRYPAFGTFMVDNVRRVVGPKPIAWAEDVAYGIQDWVNRKRYASAPPATYWAPPPGAPSGSGSGEAPPPPTPHDDAFPPPGFAPPFPAVATAGDGQWIAMPDPHDPGGPTGLYKALVHPDGKRGFAVVAIVAIDLRNVDVTAVPGFGEPQSNAMPREKRPGLVPRDDFPNLLACFNGGFQAVHGQWGMMVDGVTLLAARPIGCTVAKYKDSSMRVAVWKRIADSEPDMVFFRQTPPCLVEEGNVNPATQAEKNTGWGATVDGDTIIRRSAFGLDKTGKIAFYGMGDGLSAGTLAKAMHVAGAWDVAQLDVNWQYPRFFTYDGGKEPKIAQPLAPVQNYKPDEYTGKSEYRDFFYLTKKAKKKD